MLKLAHIINPVKVDASRDLFTAQPITFQTMRVAKDRAGPEVTVELHAASFREDEEVVPPFLRKTRPLERSILDLGDFKTRKRLPLIKDILDRLFQESSADYFIYTNVDIALQPEFYASVGELIREGTAGFVINRRTISPRHTRIEEIPLMYKEGKKGQKHPGFDCFIFPREAYARFLLGDGCLGANWIGRIMVSNIAAFSSPFRIFKDLHLTFHLGDDRVWLNRESAELERHNEKELITVLDTLLDKEGINNRDLLEQFYTYHLRRVFSRGRPSDNVGRNSPQYRLPDKPARLYPSGPASTRPGDKVGGILRQDPIFVVGYPRSGTTYLQALIATQEKVISLPETHFFSRAWKTMKVKGEKIQPGCLDRVIRTIRSGLPLSINAETHLRRTAGLSPKMLFETVIIDNIINQVDHRELKDIRWMEKTPLHVFHLDKIFRFYPRAKVVCVMRNPEKAIISRRQTFLFNNETRWPVRRHVRQWLAGIARFEQARKLRPDSLVLVRFEDLVENRDREMARLCAFLGISLDMEKLDGYKIAAGTLVQPWELWKSDLTRAMPAEKILRRQDHLSAGGQFDLWRLAGTKMAEYGYPMRRPRLAVGEWFVYRTKSLILEFRLLMDKALLMLPVSVSIKIRKAYRCVTRRWGG
jgi:Sulfotransferase family